MDRREFMGASAVAGIGLLAGRGFGAAKDFDLEEATVASLQVAMQKGEVTARDLVVRYMARIGSHDKQTNSIIELNPDALQIAAQLDAERRAGKLRGSLHGIPIVLKDNIDTADKMKSTAGSLALMDAPVPKRDAFLVEQLRRAGVVILGKANLSEWANFRSTNSTSGWSGRGGQTRNPYILDRNPCGSSSGSAVAVAANLAAAAIGTETDGSIVCPASVNGIVGLKPTVGLVSRSGIIPIAAAQDTAGPMTRTVADAAIVLGVLAGGDERDAATAGVPMEFNVGFAPALKPHALRGAKVGVLRGPFGFRPWLEPILATTIARLREAGAEIVDL